MVQLEIQDDVQREFQIKELCSFRRTRGETYAVVGDNADMRLISDVWFGSFETQSDFRVVFEFLLDQFRRKRYQLWLCDLRFLSRSFVEDQTWLTEKVLPAIFDAGLDRGAVVFSDVGGLPKRYDVQSAVTLTLGRLSDGRVRGFTDVLEAKSWLRRSTIPVTAKNRKLVPAFLAEAALEAAGGIRRSGGSWASESAD